jgi:hypothetical protein
MLFVYYMHMTILSWPTNISTYIYNFIFQTGQLASRSKRSVILIFYFFESRATCSSLVSVFKSSSQQLFFFSCLSLCVFLSGFPAFSFSPLRVLYTLNSGGNCSVLSLTNKKLNRDEHRLLCREPSQGTEPRRLNRYSSGGDDLFSESMSIMHKLTGADPRRHCRRELP